MIDDKTLLQTDATVIAGLLILVTIYSLGYPITRQAKIQRILLGFVISPTIVPFSMSALFIISGQQILALGGAMFGFIWIIIGISIIIILPVIGISYETGKPYSKILLEILLIFYKCAHIETEKSVYHRW